MSRQIKVPYSVVNYCIHNKKVSHEKQVCNAEKTSIHQRFAYKSYSRHVLRIIGLVCFLGKIKSSTDRSKNISYHLLWYRFDLGLFLISK